MVSVPFVDLRAQYRTLAPAMERALSNVLEHCGFILGKDVDAFERAFAEMVTVPHAVGVSSGLDALTLALRALDVGPGDEVVVPANTYIASTLAISAVGATPRLVDCSADTYNVEAEAMEAAIGPRTRALMPVHLTGMPAEMDPILALGERRGLPVVEDAAQAHGATYRGRQCGSMGSMGCFSFYPGKNLGGYGDGGLVTTRDGSLAERCRVLRNYGQREKYVHVEKGLNARLDTLQAAILNVKLPHLQEWNAARRSHAAGYRSALDGVGDLRFQQVPAHVEHVYHLFIVETEQRDALRAHLEKAGVQTGIHYPIPIHLQPAYAELGHRVGAFPNAERSAARMLSLPMFAELTRAQIDHVVASIKAFF
jgi:dTDP-4-amino-4,6-dideoxygalactose transaminase